MTEYKPAHIVAVFREAQTRADKISAALGDLEWFDGQGDEQVRALLIEVRDETAKLLRRLEILTASPRESEWTRLWRR